MATSWFVRGGDKVYGPLDAARLRQLVTEKKINESTEVAQNHAGPWVPAGKVRGLFDGAPPNAVRSAPQTAAPTYTPPAVATTLQTADETNAAPIVNVKRRITTTRHSKNSNGTIAVVAGICSIVSLGLGYFAGREHLRYQIRSSFEDAGKKFAKDLKEGLGKAFSGEVAKEEEKKRPPAAKLKLRQPFDTAEASITVTSARIDRPVLKGGFRNSTSKHDEDCLVIGMSIRNKDSRKQLNLNYGHPFGDNTFTMHDDVGNKVDTTFFSRPGSDFVIVGAHPSYKDVDPEQTVEHFVAFEPPLPKTKSLSLLIDKQLIGQDGIVQVDIPISEVEGFFRK